MSLRFDGEDDFVDLGALPAGHPLLLAGSPFTLSAWFRQEDGGDPYQRIIDRSDGVEGHDGWALAAHSPDGSIHFYSHDGARGGDFVSSARAYTTGGWHHVVAVARPRWREIWIDGQRDRGSWYESGAHALPAPTPTRARLGSWNHAEGRKWMGWLDEVAVWRIDLPDAAIRDLHESRGRGDLGRAWGHYRYADWLVGWWRMGDGPEHGAGSLLTDLSGLATHGALLPAPPAGTPPHFDAETHP